MIDISFPVIYTVTKIITLKSNTMRNIMNISLPVELMRDVERQVKKGRFASVSEYVRQLIRSDTLYEELVQQEKDFTAGRGILLKSLKDLD